MKWKGKLISPSKRTHASFLWKSFADNQWWCHFLTEQVRYQDHLEASRWQGAGEWISYVRQLLTCHENSWFTYLNFVQRCTWWLCISLRIPMKGRNIFVKQLLNGLKKKRCNDSGKVVKHVAIFVYTHQQNAIAISHHITVVNKNNVWAWCRRNTVNLCRPLNFHTRPIHFWNAWPFKTNKWNWMTVA